MPGERPTSLQILSFGAAGFSIGLAVTLVGIGLAVVVMLSEIAALVFSH